MNVIPEEIKKQAEELGIKIRQGRIGEWNEYVEFDPNRVGKNPKIVVQKTRMVGTEKTWWVVYKVYPGKKGSVSTLFVDEEFEKALAIGFYEASK